MKHGLPLETFLEPFIKHRSGERAVRLPSYLNVVHVAAPRQQGYDEILTRRRGRNLVSSQSNNLKHPYAKGKKKSQRPIAVVCDLWLSCAAVYIFFLFLPSVGNTATVVPLRGVAGGGFRGGSGGGRSGDSSRSLCGEVPKAEGAWPW